jgi:hypothetical protein
MPKNEKIDKNLYVNDESNDDAIDDDSDYVKPTMVNRLSNHDDPKQLLQDAEIAETVLRRKEEQLAKQADQNKNPKINVNNDKEKAEKFKKLESTLRNAVLGEYDPEQLPKDMKAGLLPIQEAQTQKKDDSETTDNDNENSVESNVQFEGMPTTKNVIKTKKIKTSTPTDKDVTKKKSIPKNSKKETTKETQPNHK